MLKIKRLINRQILKPLACILSNLFNFHLLEIVNRVSETQLQVGENTSYIIWRLKGYHINPCSATWSYFTCRRNFHLKVNIFEHVVI